MADIKDLLLKFQNLLDKSEVDKGLIVKIFKKVLQKDILQEDVSFKKDILFIKSDAYLKAEIILNKDALLKEIKKEGIEKIVKDIK